MAFEDNLQALRAARRMTQEQLAMLVGVSRQAISKWESGKAYPEMDKLLILCDLFDVTLDDLVLGDVTTASGPAPAAEDDAEGFPGVTPVPTGTAYDVTGYDEHMRRFANRIAWGVAVIVLGVAVGNSFDSSGSVLGADNPYNDVCAFLSIMVGVLIGCALLIPAGLSHTAFQRRHPYVQDFYSDADHAAGRRELAVCLVAGMALIVVGVAFSVVADEAWGIHDGWPYSLMLICIAMGVWCFIRGGMDYGRLNIDDYNRKSAGFEDAGRQGKSRYDAINEAVCGIIMILATIVGLSLLFLFVDGAAHVYFWLSWPIGGLLCGISTLVFTVVKTTKA
ncbi:helix-turn-helix transcriptional regulator [Bifidobacterium cuniculi]|uniref:Xre-type transcriptional regulator n=1 Tax=Bifidobacterium cuniculi TaxID=1688 RepID=A0A087AX71_9BIFI|nr:helix-turn-helix transcriptional regulator [Bifidobacterium cuniculi]KFI63371.1 Xre-type transcriptional regulator [Bifidobacterium cuniculi]